MTNDEFNMAGAHERLVAARQIIACAGPCEGFCLSAKNRLIAQIDENLAKTRKAIERTR